MVGVVAVAALVSAVIALGNKEADALRRGLLFLQIFKGHLGCAGEHFAVTVAVGDDVRRLGIEEVENGCIQTAGTQRIGAGDQFNLCVWGGSAGPLDIESRLNLISILPGIGAGRIRRW